MVIMALSVVSVVVITRLLYRRVRRSRALNDAVLRARTGLTIGPQHDVMRLRLRLRQTLVSGQEAVALAGRSQGPHGDLQRLFRRVLEESSAVQAQLILLSSERDPVVLAEALPQAGRRVDQISGLVKRIRGVVAAGLGARTDDSLTALQDDVDREIAAVDAGVAALHDLNMSDSASALPRLGRGSTS